MEGFLQDPEGNCVGEWGGECPVPGVFPKGRGPETLRV